MKRVRGCLVLVAVGLIGLFALQNGGQRGAALPTLMVLPSVTPSPPAPLPQGEGSSEVAAVATVTDVRGGSGFITMTVETPPLTPPRIQGGEQEVAATATITETVIPEIVNTEVSVESTSQIEQGLKTADVPEILSVYVADDIKRVQIVFRTSERVAGINLDLQRVLCAARGLLPQGYALRLHGKPENNLGVVDAMVAADRLAQINCEVLIDWPSVAEEYSLASGLSGAPAPTQQLRMADVTQPADITILEPVTIYAESEVNVRECARTSCARMGQVPRGTALVADALLNGDEVQPGNLIWYRVAYGRGVGYVYSGVMQFTNPLALPTQQQQNPPQQQQNFTCPSNCDGARAMGLTASQAATCPGLDRDGDGVACYDD